MGYFDSQWAPYVPVAERRRNAVREIDKHMKRHGRSAAPVVIEGRTIARTFWGKAWCENLERYSDFSNRIPRGRTYVRNGSVVDLHVDAGKVHAFVAGSSLYEINITIRPLAPELWRAIVSECAGRIGSLVELLGGRLSDGVMAVLARGKDGLFPAPAEIDLRCSCPDGAYMCKHVAAVLYGVGARLDTSPELFFKLRKVDQLDLIASAEHAPTLGIAGVAKEKQLAGGADLSALFGIDLAPSHSPAPAPLPATKRSPSKLAPATKPPSQTEPAKKTANAKKTEAARKTANARKTEAARKTETDFETEPTSMTWMASAIENVSATAFATVSALKRSPSRDRLQIKPQPAFSSPAPKVSRVRPTSRTISGAQLLSAGIPSATLQSWIATSLLVATAEQGVYLRTPKVDHEIEQLVRRALAF